MRSKLWKKLRMRIWFSVNLELSLDQYSLFYGVLASILQAAAYLQFESLSHTYQVGPALQALLPVTNRKLYQAMEMLYMHSFNSLIVFLIADVVQVRAKTGDVQPE